ncbi:antitoxin of toxin-antitoxin stability system [Variovorax sp. J22R133]|nr:antitoxin of toxin-antitoxin stability system [Variovorax sp. J22R133]MDM0112764.1 antitoxin of toxin-antitoxin stability system [Variovorax sp. J22R133]
MTKEAVFTLKLEPDLRDSFRAAARAAHRPASQLMRELMREFIQRQRQAGEQEEARSRKADAIKEAPATPAAVGRSNEEIEAEFAALRARAAGQR